MKTAILVGLLLGLASLQLVLGQKNCGDLYKSCSDCTADPGCGWCGPVGTCYNGTDDGPAGDQKCFGDAWFYGPDECPDCASLKTCESCLHWVSDCGWCTTTNTCAEWGPGTLGCKPARVCPCETYDECSDCVNKPHCTWCSSNTTCINTAVAASCPMVSHTCPCNLNKDCHSCREDSASGCQWCESGGVGGGGSCVNAANAGGCTVPLTCNSYCQAVGGSSCALCNQLNGCGWCGDTNQCVDSAYATCMLRHSCPNCAAHRYCDPCMDEGSDCVWCASGECREAVNAGADCMATHTCQSYCAAISSCSTCSEVPGCGWCEHTKSCVDADESSCLLVHSCSDAGCKFDGGAFVGGMFLGIGLVAIGIGGFLFYRWKMGNRNAYNELK